MTLSLSTAERQHQILQILQRDRRLSLAEVCERFAVSEATARRDLESLAAGGRLQRVRGGAIALLPSPPEQPVLQRQEEQKDEKERIARAASALVQDGETVFLGSGTTVLEAARLLGGRRGLTVLTNSLPVVNALAGTEGLSLICLGGMLRASELSFIGHITEQALAEVHADKVLIGTRSISIEHGLTNEYMPETLTDRAILKCGREIIVLADHTKFGRTAAVLLAPLASIHAIVTTDETPPDLLAALEGRGLRLVLA